jgi:hypothetical protein
MKNKKIELLLYKSFDSELSKEESESLNKELESSDELRELYSQTSRIRELAADSASYGINPFFEEIVLKKINEASTKNSSIPGMSEQLVHSFAKVAFTATIVLVLLVFYNLNKGNNLSIENALGKSKSPIEVAFDPTFNLIWTQI